MAVYSQKYGSGVVKMGASDPYIFNSVKMEVDGVAEVQIQYESAEDESYHLAPIYLYSKKPLVLNKIRVKSITHNDNIVDILMSGTKERR